MTTPTRKKTSWMLGGLAVLGWGSVIAWSHYEARGAKNAFQAATEARTEAREARAFSEEQANLTHSLLTLSALAIVSTDMKGNIVAWNEGAVKRLGWKPDEVIGKPLEFLMADGIDPAKHHKAFEDNKVSEWVRKGIALDCSVRTRDGNAKRVLVFAYEVNKPPARFVAYLHMPKEIRVNQEVPTLKKP